ncbi:hypothetical protein HRI_002647000 [Hibiscus trionum]|uniref:Reverse transcriptase n=1 Tax=Hibiscus trionum TaxID=183268 RepID=A0A9W7M4R8_HIBTR|nr:hypothetical protein HRI_002647000 [Hibiscus trionum]
MVDFKNLLDESIGKVVGSMNINSATQGATGSAPSSSNPVNTNPAGATMDDTGPEVTILDTEDPKERNEDQIHTGNWAYKLLCPKFDGSDFKGWLCKLEQYFEAERTLESAKVRMVMLHLEGKALQWHHFATKNISELNQLTWNQYLTKMKERFAPGGFEDPFSDLVGLWQTDSVEKYYEDFIDLLNQVNLPDDYVLSLFKAHLRLEISQYVQLLHPSSLSEAFQMAKHLESMFFPGPKRSYSSFSRTVAPSAISIPPRPALVGFKGSVSGVNSSAPSIASRNTTPKALSPVHPKGPSVNNSRGAGKALSAVEIEERRRKGLCFWCAAKYSPGHKCQKSQLYQILVEGIEEEGEQEEFLDCEDHGELTNIEGPATESPILSLQAIWGTDQWETMKLRIRVGNMNCVALLDSGSTHNFISLAVVKKLGMLVDKRKQLRVTVADGNSLGTLGECLKVKWEAQGYCFQSDFLVLALRNCDVVLGVQWFSQLGTIKWDFAELKMEFRYNGELVELKGCKSESFQWTDTKACAKLMRGTTSPCNFSLMALNAHLEMKGTVEKGNQGIQVLLKEFWDVFEEPKDLPPERAQDHRIPLINEDAVIKVKPYRYPSVQKDIIEKMVAEMLQSGIIRDSTSAFSSPIVMVRKKDESWRMCIDYRRLNQVTVKDKFPMPVIEELLDELGRARVFSKLDLRSGYHQIRMWGPDIHKTAFRTHEGHYEFLVMPFGLTNAHATFQGLMNKVFKGLLRKSVLVFFNDILVYSEDWDSHLKDLKEVLGILREHRLFAKQSKCCFGATEMDYLGYSISGGKIAMDKEKVQCIMEWPAPVTIKELRGFLGLSGYYRRFIKQYGWIARPLTNLLRKGGWRWTQEEEVAFKKLKEAISSAPTLVLPNWDMEFVVETDASELGIRAVLTQCGRPLAFLSKGLGVRHQALSVYEKEMMAALVAVKKWSNYLIGRHFKIKTDHQSLRFLTENQAVTPAQQKWVIKMMGYDFEVCYKKGINNTVADALSRRPGGVQLQNLVVSSISTEFFKRIANSWEEDDKLKKIIEDLKNGSGKHSKYAWDGRQLKRKGKLVIGGDADLRKELIEYFHASPIGGHSGAHATIKRLGALMYWKGMRKEVKRWVRECTVCQRNKADLIHPRGLLQPLPILESAWSSISMDFIEGLPTSRKKDVIMVVVDRLTKYGHFIALAHPFTTKDVAQCFMENIFKLHGLPGDIICDRDKVFMSLFWRELFQKLGVKIKPSTAYHPQTDGQTEKVNQCLEAYLRCMSGEKPKEWGNWLHLAEWWYNTSFHSAIQTTPYQALYGQAPGDHLPYTAGESLVASVDRGLQQREAALKMVKFYLQRAQIRMKQQADKRRTECEYQIGDLVYLKLQPYRQQTVKQRTCQKLAPKWFGPFYIIGKVGSVAYKLQLPRDSRVHPIFHVSQLKKHIGSADYSSELHVINPDGEISKEPLRIVDMRIGKRGGRAIIEVLVEWTNAFPEDATWESLHQLQACFPDFHP